MRSRSFRRTLVITAVAAVALASLYEVTMFDSQSVANQAPIQEALAMPTAGARIRFLATAYCKGDTTSTGVTPQSGIAAADPDLLPAGSVLHVSALGSKYDGIYTILDSGPQVQGRRIDLYMWSCKEAVVFGARQAQITVLRLGWNPRATEVGK